MCSKPKQSEVFDLVTVHDDILKSASPSAKRIITENQLWFSHFFYIVKNAATNDNREIINQFWRSTPLFVMKDRPNWFVPSEVLDELVDICRRNNELQR